MSPTLDVSENTKTCQAPPATLANPKGLGGVERAFSSFLRHSASKTLAGQYFRLGLEVSSLVEIRVECVGRFGLFFKSLSLEV